MPCWRKLRKQWEHISEILDPEKTRKGFLEEATTKIWLEGSAEISQVEERLPGRRNNWVEGWSAEETHIWVFWELSVVGLSSLFFPIAWLSPTPLIKKGRPFTPIG